MEYGKRRVVKYALAGLGVLLLAGCAGRTPLPDSLGDGRLQKPVRGKGMLYVYRPASFVGAAVYYDIHDSAQGDKVLGTITAGSVVSAQLNPGPREIWAKTEARRSVPVNLGAGETQCIKAGVGMGIFIGRPTLDKVTIDQCRREIAQIVRERKRQKEETKKGEDLGFGFAHKKR